MYILNKRLALVLFFASFTVLTQAQKPKGTRTLAWQVDLPESQFYDSSFKYANNACMEVVHLFYPWKSIEPTNGSFDQSFMAQNLDVANLYYPITGTAVELQLAPINAHVKEVPSDLASVSFNNTQMINRYKALLDTLFDHIPNVTLAALNIGNESAANLQGNATFYMQYKAFLDSVVPYAKQKYFALHKKVLKVGTTLTFHALTDTATAALCKNLNMNLDHVAVTYYPLNSDFTMQDPSVVLGDFGKLVLQYPSMPIYFAECGFSSSTFCNSSEEKQALFYQNIFSAWDSFSNQISTITVFKSNDWSKHEVNGLAAFYGINDTIFKEYLRTLGVRNWEGSGSNKLAYDRILCELDNRDWCSSAKCQLSDIAIPGIEPSKLQVYPNPSAGHFYLSGDDHRQEIRVFNLMGQILMQQTYSNSIDLSNMKNGLYLIYVTNNQGDISSFRVTKQTN